VLRQLAAAPTKSPSLQRRSKLRPANQPLEVAEILSIRQFFAAESSLGRDDLQRREKRSFARIAPQHQQK
jgi:hypothetical protein